MQNLNTRQAAIIEILNRDEYCSIDELASQFEVTTQTIRRDIKELCDLGYARRHHGGVGLPNTLSNRSYGSRHVSYQDEKQLIASQVISQIPNGCTLFLGIGTTIAAIAEKLRNHSELRVVTNNFEAAHVLSQYPNIETWITPGKIRTNDLDVVGMGTAPFFGQFVADIGIIGCAAISHLPKQRFEQGEIWLPDNDQCETIEFAMEHELQEAVVSQAILAGSSQKWLVAHQKKWQRHANARVAPLNYFDQVFCGKKDQTAVT